MASLMTPLLVLLFGIHLATAVGSTDPFYAAITKSGGSVVHAQGPIDYRASFRSVGGSQRAFGLGPDPGLWSRTGAERG